MKDHFIKNFQNKKGQEIVIKHIDYFSLFEFNEFLKKSVSKSKDFYQIKKMIINRTENDNIINIMKLIQDNQCILICSFHQNKIIGFSGVIIDNMKNNATFEIFINKQYRNTGIGKELTLSIIKYSSLIGIKKINLSVRKNNINAIKLYRKNGFKEETTSNKNNIKYQKSIVSSEILMYKRI
jgi:ribosomal protein S18 acetylase RimI-like enzyme